MARKAQVGTMIDYLRAIDKMDEGRVINQEDVFVQRKYYEKPRITVKLLVRETLGNSATSEDYAGFSVKIKGQYNVYNNKPKS